MLPPAPQKFVQHLFRLGERYEVQLLSFPHKFPAGGNIATLHIRDWLFSLTQGVPSRLLGTWTLADLR